MQILAVRNLLQSLHAQSSDCPLDHLTHRNPDRVANVIGPEKFEPNHQPAQRDLQDRVDPQGVIKRANHH